MRNLPKHLLGACLFLSLAVMGRANSININLGGGLATFNAAAPFDQAATPGQSFTLTLMNGTPVTQTFYTAGDNALCSTCSGTLFATLTGSLSINDETNPGLGFGQFAQQYSDMIAGGGATHSFQALLSPAITVALSNGETLTITPLASSVVSVNFGPAFPQSVSATFLLGTPAAAPEPSSILLSGTALGGALILVRRKRVPAA